MPYFYIEIDKERAIVCEISTDVASNFKDYVDILFNNGKMTIGLPYNYGVVSGVEDLLEFYPEIRLNENKHIFKGQLRAMYYDMGYYNSRQAYIKDSEKFGTVDQAFENGKILYLCSEKA